MNEEDIMEDIKPIKTRGDGNCLFNAVSLAISAIHVFLFVKIVI